MSVLLVRLLVLLVFNKRGGELHEHSERKKLSRTEHNHNMYVLENCTKLCMSYQIIDKSR